MTYMRANLARKDNHTLLLGQSINALVLI